jgi:hypothetical protein
LETGFQRLLREKGPIRNANLREGQGVPPIKILDRIHIPRAQNRTRFHVAAAGVTERIAPAIGLAGHLRRAFGVRSDRAFFLACQAFYAMRDRIAGLRNRLPGKPEIAGSTVLAYGAVGLMSAILINDLFGPTPANSSVSPTPDARPEWVEIARPHAAFALESPLLQGIEPNYKVRLHRLGGGRKDEMTFGGAAAHGPYVRVSLYRPGREGMADPDPLGSVVAVASNSGIDADLQETSGKIRTKFGDLPAINMRVQGKDGWRNCVAATGTWSDPRFGLVVWWCNPGYEIVALGELACLIDRIALMSAGGDGQLAEFFARAELRRIQCDSRSSFVSPTPRLVNNWIHAKRAPDLRGRLSAQ